MKKRFTFLTRIASLSLVLFVCSVAAAGQPGDWAVHGLIGKVKSFDERGSSRFVENGKEKEEAFPLLTTKYFDEKGRLTRRDSRDITNSTSVVRYAYEKGGARKAFTESARPFEEPGKASISGYLYSVFTFDAAENSILEGNYRGRRLSANEWEAGERWHQFKYFFDAKNRLIKLINMSPEGTDIMTELYTYGVNESHPSHKAMTYRGLTVQSIEYSYRLDSHGNWTRRTAIKRPIDPRNPVITEITDRKISYYKD